MFSKSKTVNAYFEETHTLNDAQVVLEQRKLKGAIDAKIHEGTQQVLETKISSKNQVQISEAQDCEKMLGELLGYDMKANDQVKITNICHFQDSRSSEMTTIREDSLQQVFLQDQQVCNYNSSIQQSSVKYTTNESTRTYQQDQEVSVNKSSKSDQSICLEAVTSLSKLNKQLELNKFNSTSTGQFENHKRHFRRIQKTSELLANIRRDGEIEGASQPEQSLQKIEKVFSKSGQQDLIGSKVQERRLHKQQQKKFEMKSWLDKMYSIKVNKEDHPIQKLFPSEKVYTREGPLDTKEEKIDKDFILQEHKAKRNVVKHEYTTSGPEQKVEIMLQNFIENDKNEIQKFLNNRVHSVCLICKLDNVDLQEFTSLKQLRKHKEEKHDIFECRVCEVKFDSKSKIVKHRQKKHKVKAIDKCSNCGQCFDKESAVREHRLNSEILACRITCQFEECGNNFGDLFELERHTERFHLKTQEPTYAFEITMQRSHDKFINVKYQPKQIKINEQIRAEFGFSDKIEEQDEQEDDLISLKVNNKLTAIARVLRLYEDQKTFLIIKKIKQYDQDQLALGHLIEYIVDWATSQRTGKIYIKSGEISFEFLRAMRFYKVVDASEKQKVQEKLKIQKEEILMMRYNKKYTRDFPIRVEYPTSLPQTEFTKRLRKIRQIYQEEENQKMIQLAFKEAFAGQRSESKYEAQISDQWETPDEILDQVAQSIMVERKEMWDVNTFAPDWKDGINYNALKQKFAGKINWCNPPFSATLVHLMQGVKNWIEGRSTVFLVRQLACDKAKVRALAEKISQIVPQGLVIFKGAKKNYDGAIALIFMMTPEHLEYMMWKKQLNRGKIKATEEQKIALLKGKIERKYEKEKLALTLMDQKVPQRVISRLTGIRSQKLVQDILPKLNNFQAASK